MSITFDKNIMAFLLAASIAGVWTTKGRASRRPSHVPVRTRALVTLNLASNPSPTPAKKDTLYEK